MDDASKERLVRDGFVVLKNVVDPERVVAARRAVNSVRIMFCAPLPLPACAACVLDACTHAACGAPGLFYSKRPRGRLRD